MSHLEGRVTHGHRRKTDTGFGHTTEQESSEMERALPRDAQVACEFSLSISKSSPRSDKFGNAESDSGSTTWVNERSSVLRTGDADFQRGDRFVNSAGSSADGEISEQHGIAILAAACHQQTRAIESPVEIKNLARSKAGELFRFPA